MWYQTSLEKMLPQETGEQPSPDTLPLPDIKSAWKPSSRAAAPTPSQRQGMPEEEVRG